MNENMVLHFHDVLLAQQDMMRDLARNDLLFIEALQLKVSPEILGDTAEVVRSTLHSVDALTDRIRQFASQVDGLKA